MACSKRSVAALTQEVIKFSHKAPYLAAEDPQQARRDIGATAHRFPDLRWFLEGALQSLQHSEAAPHLRRDPRRLLGLMQAGALGNPARDKKRPRESWAKAFMTGEDAAAESPWADAPMPGGASASKSRQHQQQQVGYGLLGNGRGTGGSDDEMGGQRGRAKNRARANKASPVKPGAQAAALGKGQGKKNAHNAKKYWQDGQGSLPARSSKKLGIMQNPIAKQGIKKQKQRHKRAKGIAK